MYFVVCMDFELTPTVLDFISLSRLVYDGA